MYESNNNNVEAVQILLFKSGIDINCKTILN